MTYAPVIIRNLVKDYMNLPDEQVYIMNSNFKSPDKPDLIYCAIGLTSSTPYSSESSIFEDENNNLFEKTAISVEELITINIYSVVTENFTDSLFTRKYEVLQALNSLASQQAQDENIIKIVKYPESFVDNSEELNGQNLLRYTIDIRCFVGNTKVKAIDPSANAIYTSFQAVIKDDNNKTPDIEVNV